MTTIYTEYKDAESFLATVRQVLERHESANGLMLGLALRLEREPNAYGSQPYFATVEYTPAPGARDSAAGLRVVALMTPPYKLQLYSHEEHGEAGLEMVAEGLRRGRWPVPGVMGREAVAEAFASLWCQTAGGVYHVGMRQGVYELRAVRHPAYPPGEIRQAGAGDLDLVRRWAHGFHEDCFGDGQSDESTGAAERLVNSGDLFLWVDGAPRSMAARTRPTPHGQAVSYVYTPPVHRERGFATALVARLSQMILDGGKQFCTLYTNLDNPTSNSIYMKIGYARVANVVDVYFR